MIRSHCLCQEARAIHYETESDYVTLTRVQSDGT